jgi:hypothetical protein
LWEANELFDYWQDYPPTHVLVGAYLRGGKKEQGKVAIRNRNKTSLDELAHAVVLAGGGTDQKLPRNYKA